jgi:hypothetical protein
VSETIPPGNTRLPGGEARFAIKSRVSKPLLILQLGQNQCRTNRRLRWPHPNNQRSAFAMLSLAMNLNRRAVPVWQKFACQKLASAFIITPPVGFPRQAKIVINLFGEPPAKCETLIRISK